MKSYSMTPRGANRWTVEKNPLLSYEGFMPAIRFGKFSPVVHPGVFLAPDAWVTGRVEIEEGASIFFGCVLRGDIERVHIGKGSNLQEHTVCHTTTGMSECLVGQDVTVGHRVTLHGCRIEDNCVIGMGSTILDDSVIGENCIIGAHSLITKGTIIPPGTLALGSPASVIRKLRPEEIEGIRQSAEHYRALGAEYISIFAELYPSVL